MQILTRCDAPWNQKVGMQLAIALKDSLHWWPVEPLITHMCCRSSCCLSKQDIWQGIYGCTSAEIQARYAFCTLADTGDSSSATACVFFTLQHLSDHQRYCWQLSSKLSNYRNWQEVSDLMLKSLIRQREHPLISSCEFSQSTKESGRTRNGGFGSTPAGSKLWEAQDRRWVSNVNVRKAKDLLKERHEKKFLGRRDWRLTGADQAPASYRERDNRLERSARRVSPWDFEVICASWQVCHGGLSAWCNMLFL